MQDNKKKSGASQAFVPIEEVRDGIVILKDGALRGVFMASSTNLALKGQDEQQAILTQFGQFLDSLDFSVQFFVQSRKLDIRPYVAMLEARYVEQTEELMKIQVREYVDFIKTFTEGANIMTKSFFVVVPYAPAIIGSVSTMNPFAKKEEGGEASKATFEENRSQLEQRMGIVQQGLLRSGVRVAQLGTEEVIELFYKMFNMGELERPIPLDNRA